jgi:hypothetical protein
MLRSQTFRVFFRVGCGAVLTHRYAARETSAANVCAYVLVKVCNLPQTHFLSRLELCRTRLESYSKRHL